MTPPTITLRSGIAPTGTPHNRVASSSSWWSRREPSHNSSNKYPTIGRSEASDAQTPSDRLVRNLNPEFNTVWLQTIMESIQCMTPEGSSLVVLAQQGDEATGQVIVAERSIGHHQGDTSVGN
jgi:hypothetical protein